MRSEQDETLVRRRLEEIAERANRVGRCFFSDFLSPPEAQWALQAAKRGGVCAVLEGGYEDAERRMACFYPSDQDRPEEAFPLAALSLRWPQQKAPAHRDLLGSVMGLGIERRCVGDIIVGDEQAILFCQTRMADHIEENLLSAGRVRLEVSRQTQITDFAPPQGKEIYDTVLTPRLDAVIAGGFGLSRAKAAALIAAGQVKLRHLPNEHADARVAEADAISVRGMGRLKIVEIGQPSKKGRYPLRMLRYGEKRST